MKLKILSIQSFACGTEAFSFSELFINSNGREETLPINVLLCEHRKYGHFLVNTGCSSCLKKNKARFVLYKQKHKLNFSEDDDIIEQLQKEDIDPRLIRKVLLTHCSPECCGALPLLPKYEILSSAGVLCLIKTGDVDGDMMKSTLPDPSVPIRAAGIYQGETFLRSYFKWIFDLFGDGSVLGFELPGHCQSMTGFYFPEHHLLYAADAAVDERVLTEDLVPSEKLLSQQSLPDEYLLSLSSLRRICREHPEVTIRFLHSPDITACFAE